MRYASAFTLMKAIRRSSETLNITKGNIDEFSSVCVSKIEIIEDVGTYAVEVRLVKTRVDSPNQ